MKEWKYIFCIVCLVAAFGIHIFASEIKLNKVMEVSDRIGGEEELLASISDVAVDFDENIFILDPKMENIKKYSGDGVFVKAFSRRGEGPGEFTEFWLLKIAVTSDGSLVVADNHNHSISIFDNAGVFKHSFRTSQVYGLAVDAKDQIIISTKGNKVFSVYDIRGDKKYSFGNFFDIPKEEEYKRFEPYKGMRTPGEFYYSTNRKQVLAMHTFKYEIWGFDRYTQKNIAVRAETAFHPVFYGEYKGRELIRRAFLPVYEYKEYLFVTVSPDKSGESFRMDVFFKDRYIGGTAVRGHLSAIDQWGNLYFVEENGESLCKYSVEIDGRPING